MSEQWLQCLVCGAQYDVSPMFAGCPKCAARGTKAAVEVRYEYGRVQPQPDNAPGIWKWRALLPRVAEEHVVSLGEGSTPLIPLSGGALLLKNESVNPTWSYKDRANSVSVSMAREFGYLNVVAISTGNHGNAAAAYSAAGGRRCLIFCHEQAPELQLALMRHYGAAVFQGGRQAEMVKRLVGRGDWFPSVILCPRDGSANPFGLEGFKVIAFEIFEQLAGRIPDRVFVPVGSGDGIYGIWKGFMELCAIGRAGRTPRMYACQAAGANPYVRAFCAGAHHLTAVNSAKTVALSIAEKIGSEQALRVIYESGGAALEADDEEILRTATCLAHEGFALEPASACAVACARRLENPGSEIWVAIGTGAAVKWPPSITNGFRAPEKLPADFDKVEELL